MDNIKYFSDSKIDENDVLSRYYYTAKAHHADIIVRVTSNCPLVIPELIDYAVAVRHIKDLSYTSAKGIEGIFGEVFTMKCLEDAFNHATHKYDREHVTPYIRQQYNNSYLKNFKYSVDSPNDLEFVTKIIKLIETKEYI